MPLHRQDKTTERTLEEIPCPKEGEDEGPTTRQKRLTTLWAWITSAQSSSEDLPLDRVVDKPVGGCTLDPVELMFLHS